MGTLDLHTRPNWPRKLNTAVTHGLILAGWSSSTRFRRRSTLDSAAKAQRKAKQLRRILRRTNLQLAILREPRELGFICQAD